MSILHDRGVSPAIGVEVFNLDNYALSPGDVAQKAMRAYRGVV